jgi:hypothetical protein
MLLRPVLRQQFGPGQRHRGTGLALLDTHALAAGAVLVRTVSLLVLRDFAAANRGAAPTLLDAPCLCWLAM